MEYKYKINVNNYPYDDPYFKESIQFANEAMTTFSDKMISYFKQSINLYKQSITQKYGKEFTQEPWVLFVVEDSERNVIDQKFIET